MSQVKLILQNPSFSDFYADNPEFDLLAHDFFTKAEGRISLAGADRHAGTLEMMKAYQRVLRLFPHRNEFARSEEHTSELQSLMRISYDVFCLKKKKKKNIKHSNTPTIQ